MNKRIVSEEAVALVDTVFYRQLNEASVVCEK